MSTEFEFIGSHLLLLRDGRISDKERNTLLARVWPRTTQGYRMYLPGAGGHLDKKGLRVTREWMAKAIADRFIPYLEKTHGTLEAAVTAGHARGLKQWLRWRLLDELRKHRPEEDQATSDRRYRRQARHEAQVGRVWDRAHEAGLEPVEEKVLGHVLDGLSNRKTAEAMGWKRTSEGYVRRIVEGLIRRRVLTPRWRRRPFAGIAAEQSNTLE